MATKRGKPKACPTLFDLEDSAHVGGISPMANGTPQPLRYCSADEVAADLAKENNRAQLVRTLEIGLYHLTTRELEVMGRLYVELVNCDRSRAAEAIKPIVGDSLPRDAGISQETEGTLRSSGPGPNGR